MLQLVRSRFGSYFVSRKPHEFRSRKPYEGEFRSLRQAIVQARELGYWTAQVRSRNGAERE